MKNIAFPKFSFARFLLCVLSCLCIETMPAQENKKPLQGFVDMHTHPMSQWGFGEQLFFGGVDGNPAVALGSCNCMHNFVAAPFDGSCAKQNLYRNKMVDNLEPHKKTAGYPDFANWPTHKSLVHQQMWVDWIRRAYDGGLRGMVALAVNNHCLADAAETTGPNDDLRSMNTQITKMKEFVGRHKDFMEVAYSADDFKRIVAANKLAVVIGVEMDNIGNFYNPADKKGGTYNPNPDEAAIAAEIDRLYKAGVRYIFPIHITNNAFGGTALYENGFNVTNKYNTGKTFVPEAVRTDTSGIGFALKSPYAPISPRKADNNLANLAMAFTGTIIPGNIMPNKLENYPAYQEPDSGYGHRNSMGLTDKGRFAVQYMMKKKMLIDIDHSSEKAANEILEMAVELNYPINSGHNGLRGPNGTENGRTVQQYQAIIQTGGMIGLGHGSNATNFVEAFKKVSQITVNSNVCIGTDVNGFFPLPGPPKGAEVIDSISLKPCLKGNGIAWDFNKEGFAHYGLFPEYIRSWERVGMTAEEKQAFLSTAQNFADMWRLCERYNATK